MSFPESDVRETIEEPEKLDFSLNILCLES